MPAMPHLTGCTARHQPLGRPPRRLRTLISHTLVHARGPRRLADCGWLHELVVMISGDNEEHAYRNAPTSQPGLCIAYVSDPSTGKVNALARRGHSFGHALAVLLTTIRVAHAASRSSHNACSWHHAITTLTIFPHSTRLRSGRASGRPAGAGRDLRPPPLAAPCSGISQIPRGLAAHSAAH